MNTTFIDMPYGWVQNAFDAFGVQQVSIRQNHPTESPESFRNAPTVKPRRYPPEMFAVSKDSTVAQS